MPVDGCTFVRNWLGFSLFKIKVGVGSVDIVTKGIIVKVTCISDRVVAKRVAASRLNSLWFNPSGSSQKYWTSLKEVKHV